MRTKIEDPEMNALAKLVSLEEVELRSDMIELEALLKLQALPRLKKLLIEPYHPSSHAQDILRNAFPGVTVQWGS